MMSNVAVASFRSLVTCATFAQCRRLPQNVCRAQFGELYFNHVLMEMTLFRDPHEAGSADDAVISSVIALDSHPLIDSFLIIPFFPSTIEHNFVINREWKRGKNDNFDGRCVGARWCAAAGFRFPFSRAASHVRKILARLLRSEKGKLCFHLEKSPHPASSTFSVYFEVTKDFFFFVLRCFSINTSRLST